MTTPRIMDWKKMRFTCPRCKRNRGTSRNSGDNYRSLLSDPSLLCRCGWSGRLDLAELYAHKPAARTLAMSMGLL